MVLAQAQTLVLAQAAEAVLVLKSAQLPQADLSRAAQMRRRGSCFLEETRSKLYELFASEWERPDLNSAIILERCSLYASSQASQQN